MSMAPQSPAPEATADSAAASAGRRRILDLAASLFLERGYQGTSLREIAAAVGMKPGSLYYHFRSKDELFGAILLRGMSVMTDAFVLAADETRGRDGRTRFAAHVRAHLGALFEHGPYTAAHVTTFRTAPAAVRDVIVPERDAYEAMWRDLLRELQAGGEIAADHPIGLARLTLFGAMNSAIEWFDEERGNLDDLAETIASQFWSGLSAPRGGGG